MIALQKRMHEHFGIETPDSPKMLDTAHLQMRLNFLFEELQELSLACGFGISIEEEGTLPIPEIKFVHDSVLNVNPHEILDALVDLQVVLLGTAHLLGFFNLAEMTHYPTSVKDGVPVGEQTYANINHLSVFEEAFNRVWQANMRKVACKSEEESKRGFKIDLKKPAGWKAANLSDLVEEMDKV
jgi:hypothetical protein